MNNTLITSLALVYCLMALSLGHAAEKKEVAPPSFKPGAEVMLNITIKAPRQWKLNHLMPLTLSFDEEFLKTAPFSVEETSYSFKLDSYLPRMTVSIPVKLNSKLEEGKVTIPIGLNFSICNEVTDFCAFSVETVKAPVMVQAKAESSEKNQALKSGSVEHSHLLSIP